MYHVAGVKVADAFSNVGQLLTGLSIGQLQRKEHPRVCVYPHRDIF